MKCEYGVCLFCEKKIMQECPTCSSKKPTNEYTQIMINLTNGSKMPVAVCTSCMNKPYDKKEVMQTVRDGWKREHDVMNWSQEKRDNYWKTHGEGVLEIA